MSNIKEKDIIRVKITGIQKYGAFASMEDDYNGLIHISEISYGYVKNIHDFMNVGDQIYAEVLNVDENCKQIKLSIKDIDYKKDGVKLKRMAETKNGFAPLHDHLETWINDKIKEITDNF
ncbi:MAG: S1 RNA-binding domain-containing protein [Erysipelotrichaceae bacterium]|nr:S1 RNA-binding domain-containing protein [Erysipelotrichaceae bacterium]